MPGIRVKELNDYLIYFFDGRRPAERYSREWNWFDDSAMKLGVGTYAIHRGDRAVVYDTFASVKQAKWVRAYLQHMRIKCFTVVHSHWHLDHIAGDSVYADSDILATNLTRQALATDQAAIEAGSLWGKPPVKPVVLPNITFDDRLDLYVGDVKLELHRINIHSKDSCAIVVPQDKILLAGDTLEDSLTYVVEVADLADHVHSLKVMREWDVVKIFPNHGDPDVIMGGGYDKTLIEATATYITRMLAHAHDREYLDQKIETYIGDLVEKGWVHLYEPYRDVHARNIKLVQSYYKDKTLPQL